MGLAVVCRYSTQSQLLYLPKVKRKGKMFIYTIGGIILTNPAKAGSSWMWMISKPQPIVAWKAHAFLMVWILGVTHVWKFLSAYTAFKARIRALLLKELLEGWGGVHFQRKEL